MGWRASGGRVGWLAVSLAAGWVLLLAGPSAGAANYTLSFSKYADRMSWSHRLPGWSYAVPVRLSAGRDSTSMLRLSASATLGSTVDNRNGQRSWQDNASVNTQVNYPVLGPRALIGIGGSMSVRNATLARQKLRNHSLDFRFQYSPLESGAFRSLRVSVVPGLVTASRGNRANLDSTFAETGIQYNASMSVAPEMELSGRKLNTTLSLSKTDNTLTTNKNRSDVFSTTVGYELPGNVQTTLSARESRLRTGIPRRVTMAADSDAVARDSVVVDLQDSRSSTLSSGINLEVKGFSLRNSASYTGNLRTNTGANDPDPHNTYFGKDRKDAAWSLQSDLSGKLTRKLVGSTSLRLNTGDERFLPVRLATGQPYPNRSDDRSSQDYFVNGSLDWQFAEKDRLRLDGWTELRTATNPGDREQDQDKYTNNVRLSYNGTLRGGTAVTAGISHNYAHTVNLDARQAGNNSRNRDIALDFSTRYERLGLSMSHQFNISARRLIFDFDRQLYLTEAARKSSIRRGWSMTHTWRRTLVQSLQLNGRYAYRADDFGRLLVERGAQVVEEDNGGHDVLLGMSYAPSTVLTTSASYAYQLDRKWGHVYRQTEHRVPLRRTERRTLNGSIGYNPSRTNRLQVQASRSRQSSGTFDNLSVTYTRAL